jgi:hypothetical protein
MMNQSEDLMILLQLTTTGDVAPILIGGFLIGA